MWGDESVGCKNLEFGMETNAKWITVLRGRWNIIVNGWNEANCSAVCRGKNGTQRGSRTRNPLIA